jgi:hypothetical protein
MGFEDRQAAAATSGSNYHSSDGKLEGKGRERGKKKRKILYLFKNIY